MWLSSIITQNVGCSRRLFGTNNKAIKSQHSVQKNQSNIAALIYAELSGDFPLGDSRQPTYKSLRPFDLVS